MVVARPGGSQPGLNGRTVAFGAVLEHASLLVADAALHRDRPEHFADGGPQRVGSVEDNEDAPLDVQAVVDEIGEQVRG